MKKIMKLFLVVGIFSCSINKQLPPKENSEFKVDKDGDEIYIVPDILPVFPGGDIGLRQYIVTSVRYPIEAQKKVQQGRVYVQFVVSKDGNVIEVGVAIGTGFKLLDEEALRVVKGMPLWTSGKLKGKDVNCRCTVPINFVLE